MAAEDLHLEQLDVKTVFLHDVWERTSIWCSHMIISCWGRSLQVQEESLCLETSSETVVSEVW